MAQLDKAACKGVHKDEGQTGTKDIRSFFVFGQSREAPKATVTEQTGQCFPKRYKATGEPAKQSWNVRSLTTVLHELTHLVEQQAPDFVVLTETKLRKNSRYRKSSQRLWRTMLYTQAIRGTHQT